MHLEHGIGIYRGIEKIFYRESTIESAVIEYEGGDRLNVPLYRIDQIERYRSANDISEDAPAPRLHKLGGNKWKAQREKTRMAILEMTQELLQLYARRKVTTRPSHGVGWRVAASARKQLPVRGHARPAQGHRTM
ncbi:CarD family transcriptional regulator [Gemmatimonas sp.]|uniref:CarD family transcriptional regulator n=1 Tax=Gemmatimonas sp. TaxID=1962908 RepID=UPI003DA2843B